MADRDYYDILGVSKKSSDEEIKKTYKKLAKTLHPDVNPDDQTAEARFKEVSEAYAVLGNKEKRAQYDRVGREAFDFGAGGWPGGQNGQTWDFNFNSPGGRRTRRTGRRSAPQDGNPDFGSIFSDLFGGGGGFSQPQARRGTDVESKTTIDFRDAIEGTTLSLSLKRQKECDRCSGVGHQNGRVCTVCGGTGIVSITDDIRVKIPAGVKDGQKIRISGKGSAGTGGARAGDLILKVTVRPHSFFERRDDDIHVEIPISLIEALEGAEINVPTIHGPVRARIPKGTQGGQTFRLTGKGVESKNGKAGNHFYKVRIAIPKQMGADEIETLRNIPGLAEDPRDDLPAGL